MGKLGESSIDAVEVEGMVANACTPKKKKKTRFVNKTIYIYIYIYKPFHSSICIPWDQT